MERASRIDPERLSPATASASSYPASHPQNSDPESSVFSERKGVITVILIGGYAWMPADEFDAPFSDRDSEALATFGCLAAVIPFGDDTGP